eukprot:5797972-Pyramimonas_sp.AAC.3
MGRQEGLEYLSINVWVLYIAPRFDWQPRVYQSPGGAYMRENDTAAYMGMLTTESCRAPTYCTLLVLLIKLQRCIAPATGDGDTLATYA